MELRPGIDLGGDVLASVVSPHSIRRLAMVGSVLRSDFGPASDIDLLVEFEPADRTLAHG